MNPRPPGDATDPVGDYLRALPPTRRSALQHVREIVLALVPEPIEAIRTRVPAIRYRGRTVVGFGAAKRHLALYVMFGDALEILAGDLAGYDASTKVVRFAADNPLPDSLIGRIVAIRLAEIEGKTPQA